MKELIITTTGKDPLSISNSVVGDNGLHNKSTTVRKKIVSGAAIITTIDMATINDTLAVAANISQIVSLPVSIAALAISMKHDKDKNPEINAIELKSEPADTKRNKKVNGAHNPRKNIKGTEIIGFVIPKLEYLFDI